ncbi:MAG: hypothetical protein ACRDBQ_18010 [Shewanella sp.]
MEAIYQISPDHAFGYSKSLRVWEKIDVSKSGKNLYDEYHTFELGITNLGKEFTLHSQDFYNKFAYLTTPIQDWLVANSGQALPQLTEGFPVLEYAHAHYQSIACNAGPEVYLCPPNYHYTQDFAEDDAHDLVIVCKDAVRDKYGKNGLINVNGQWVHSQMDSTGVRLPNAGRLAKRTGYIDVGIWFLNGIGNVNTYPIKGLTLNKLDTSRDYYSSLMISLPETIYGKTVGYVIGGILHWLEPKGYFGDKTIMLSLPNFSLVKTILETREFYDWDVLGAGDMSLPTSVANLRNPENFRRLLEHESSFIFVIDNPFLVEERVGVDHGASYGRFHRRESHIQTPGTELGPLFNEFGKAINYWPIWEDGEWTFHTSEITRENRLFTKGKWHNTSVINDVRPTVAASPFRTINAEMRRLKARKK